MSGKRDFDNSEFKIIAKRYVSIYGETLEKEALSEEVQALKQPEMPDLGRAKKKDSVKVAKYALIAAAVLVVCVLSFVVMATIGSIIKGEYVTSDKSSSIEEETVKWEAPNISLVGSRFTVTETKEDSGKVIYYISEELVKKSNEDENWLKIRSVVAEWYQLLRMVAIIGLLNALASANVRQYPSNFEG